MDWRKRHKITMALQITAFVLGVLAIDAWTRRGSEFQRRIEGLERRVTALESRNE